MAQHARPHWKIHSEYLRETFSRLVSGLGILPLSTRPINGLRRGWFRVRGLEPLEHSLAPGVQEPEGQQPDEDDHLDGAEPAVDLELDGPREDEHRLDVEEDEEQGEHVVPD